LEDGVDGHENGAVLTIASCETRPDENLDMKLDDRVGPERLGKKTCHGNASCKSHQDEALTKFLLVRKKSP